MKSQLKPARSPFPSDSIERILGRYYRQLVEWGRILARGDEAAAEETVQDLCLHLTVAQPDMSRVENLDNYLYMCLRNMYVSNLARVSRERLRVIQVEDYDAIGMVAARGGLDALDVQNELLRICDYALKRKYSSKSASHFILHFFLGYRRSDVAMLARVPIAAVYNGLKDVRAELRKHLSAGEKIRIVPRGAKPERQPLRVAQPSDAFLKRVRAIVFDADPADCIAEHELVAVCKQPKAPPVDHRKLAHFAGCERCLKILERASQLDDRDGPLDGVDLDREPRKDQPSNFAAVMRLVHKRREQLLEQRPALLAIAVDGRVVAFHAVESAHNSLSSRVEAAPAVRFIEVFNERGDRLAHIPLETGCAAVPGERLSQQILFSDDRRLRLDVCFDGLGIRAEVDYVDLALAPGDDAEDLRETARPPFWARFRKPVPFRLAPWGAFAFATLLLASVVGIAGYRYAHPGWRDVMAHAQTAIEMPSPTETIHRTLRIDEAGSVLGTVDVWRGSNGRVVRRLYDVQQHLVATSMDSADGASSVRREKDAMASEEERQLVESGVWRSDVSPRDFAARETTSADATRGFSGFELSAREDGRNGILVRTLVLDRSYRAQAERVRFETRDGVREIRLVQTMLRRVPAKDVPAWTFPQPNEMPSPGAQGESVLVPRQSPGAEDAGGANLQVAVLYELFQLNADTGQPIEVSPIGGRIRLTGTLANAQMLASIRERIAMLPNANRVDFQIYSAAEAASGAHRRKALRQELVGANSDAPAAGLVRNALLARGLKGAALEKAEQEFAASALAHAQSALQHAYALDRLGTVLGRAGEFPLAPDARVKWAQMVERHSTTALTELEVLRLQLDSVSAGVNGATVAAPQGIADSDAFIRATSELRVHAQAVNEEVVKLFAGSAADLSTAQTRDSIARLRDSLPLSQATCMRRFADRLATSEQNEVGEIRPR